MDPNIFAAIIGGVSGLGGAIIGGVIAARATNRATKQANDHALLLQQTAQTAIVHGVLLGIRAEIVTLWEIYSSEFGKILEELGDGQAFVYHYPLYQNYFTVYESNAPLFGQIPDDQLRKAIVTTYLKARGLIDAHLYNNHLIEKCNELQRVRDETGSARYNGQIDAALANLSGYANSLKEAYFEMKTLVGDLTRQIDDCVRLNEGAPASIGLSASRSKPTQIRNQER
jgi:hypothetical protein